MFSFLKFIREICKFCKPYDKKESTYITMSHSLSSPNTSISIMKSLLFFLFLDSISLIPTLTDSSLGRLHLNPPNLSPL